MIVAIIPARGGSKRIPRKTIRPFAGKPIIAYSIAAAQDCGLFHRIIVSTDDEEIASVARQWGADTPFVRPPELADDHADTNAVTAHALAWLAGHGQPATVACCIYATAPFIAPTDLRRGYHSLVATGKNFAFSVTTFPSSVQRALRILPQGGVVPLFPEWIEFRSQDLEEGYRDAGQFYWGKPGAFLEQVSLYGERTEPVIVPRYRVQDIDTFEDWTQAEMMYAALQSRTNVDEPG
jgi:pseudaminic acid cytidylyltransferase